MRTTPSSRMTTFMSSSSYSLHGRRTIKTAGGSRSAPGSGSAAGLKTLSPLMSRKSPFMCQRAAHRETRLSATEWKGLEIRWMATSLPG